MVKSKVKLSLIADKTTRRTTFQKRKRGMLKKLNELSTLCGVKACAVVYSGPNDSNPEAWPSREGAEKVLSDFMEVPEMERGRKMYDQHSFTWERIKKEEAKLKKLHDENRELELREFMFDLVKGKMLMEYHYYDENVIRDLSLYIDQYLNQLTHRVQSLEANGESSASFPPLDVAVADAAPPPAGYVNPVAVSDVAAVTTPTGLSDLIHQYQNMNVNDQQAHAASNDHIQYQNMNQQELAQYQVPPANVSDHMQYQNMAHQYQPLAIAYDQNQHRFYDWNQDMSSDLNHNLAESSNQHQPFMNQWMTPQAQQMSELASVAYMDDEYYRYHQLPTASHMPSTTTTVDLSAPNTNNNVWPTRFGLN